MMSEYTKELFKEFVKILHDPILKTGLSVSEKKKFNQFNHRLKKQIQISERAMRETVEKYGKKKIVILPAQ